MSAGFMKAPLLLIRGLPGSGKTTMALALKYGTGFYDVHLEADMYHMQKGVYVYDAFKATEAHQWCLDTTRVMLNIGKRVVVSNTFTRLYEIQPYLELGFEVAVEEAKGSWPSTHNVPDEVLKLMKARWEVFPAVKEP